MRIALLTLALLLPAGAVRASDRWYPAQNAPRVVVRSTLSAADWDFGPTRTAGRAEHMLLHSVAGLVAQATNEGRSDEMVWVDSSSRPDYERWYAGMVKRLGVREEGPLPTLDLV